MTDIDMPIELKKGRLNNITN